MTVANYYTVGGEIIGEKTTGGSRIDYLTDALGSVTATLNQSAQIVNTYRYKPYGGLLAKTGTGADPSFGWNGTHGYRPTAKKFSDFYVRARHYDSTGGRWTTADPIGLDGGSINVYSYVSASPALEIDPSGLQLHTPGGPINLPGNRPVNSSGVMPIDPGGIFGIWFPYWYAPDSYFNPFPKKSPFGCVTSDADCMTFPGGPCAMLEAMGFGDADGGVACCNGKAYPCVYFPYPKNKQPNLGDVIRWGCTYEHEQKHISQGTPCPPSGLSALSHEGTEGPKHECEAYQAEVKCLLRNLKWCDRAPNGARQQCRDTIKDTLEQKCAYGARMCDAAKSGLLSPDVCRKIIDIRFRDIR